MLALARLPDWETRLADYLEPMRDRPFEWGRHDCCIFALGAVEAMTGVDPMPEFRGRYTTGRGSVRALRRFGAGTVAATLTGKFGNPIDRALAQRGDIVMSDGGLGISFGDFSLMVATDSTRDGLFRVPRAEWSQAWVVPHA